MEPAADSGEDRRAAAWPVLTGLRERPVVLYAVGRSLRSFGAPFPLAKK